MWIQIADSELCLHAFCYLNVLTFLNVPMKRGALLFLISVFHVERFRSCVSGGAGFGWMGFAFFFIPPFFFLIFLVMVKAFVMTWWHLFLADVFGEEKNNFAHVMLTCLNFSVLLHFSHISLALFCCCSQSIGYLWCQHLSFSKALYPLILHSVGLKTKYKVDYHKLPQNAYLSLTESRIN